jgi:hypothetical protein
MADLRAEMSAFLSNQGNVQESTLEAKGEESPKQGEDKIEDVDEDQPEKVEEGSESSQVDEEEPSKKKEKEEEDEEDEGDDKEESKKDSPKKPNRFQRLKKQREELVKANQALTGEFHNAVKVANAWRQEALILEKELERVISEAKETGYSRSLDREQAFLSERELANHRLEKEFDEQLKQDMSHRQVQAYKENLKQQFTETANSLSEKYGVSPRKILVAYATEIEAGNRQISLEDVARDLGEFEGYRKKSSLSQKQSEVNGSAPRTIKPGKSVATEYPATAEGMKRWLIAQGLAAKE